MECNEDPVMNWAPSDEKVLIMDIVRKRYGPHALTAPRSTCAVTGSSERLSCTTEMRKIDDEAESKKESLKRKVYPRALMDLMEVSGKEKSKLGVK